MITTSIDDIVGGCLKGAEAEGLNQSTTLQSEHLPFWDKRKWEIMVTITFEAETYLGL